MWGFLPCDAPLPAPKAAPMPNPSLPWWSILALLLGWMLGQQLVYGAEARHGTASWYSVASTTREHTGGPRHLMANGKALNDDAFTAASWDYPLGTKLRVSRSGARRLQGSLSSPTDEITVVVTDRGPAHRLYRAGRILDLSKSAFESLAPLSHGVIPVTIEALP